MASRTRPLPKKLGEIKGLRPKLTSRRIKRLEINSGVFLNRLAPELVSRIRKEGQITADRITGLSAEERSGANGMDRPARERYLSRRDRALELRTFYKYVKPTASKQGHIIEYDVFGKYKAPKRVFDDKGVLVAKVGDSSGFSLTPAAILDLTEHLFAKKIRRGLK